jgi:rare lipoprotein A
MNMTRNYKSVALAIAGVIILPSCSMQSSANSKPVAATPAQPYTVKAVEHGKASWYSIRTNRGTKTASGQRLDEKAATAAHRTLPMGTKVRVTNLANNKSEIVTINDRGPFTKGRVIDVTVGSAERLGFVQRGVVPVKVEVLARNENPPEVTSQKVSFRSRKD